MPRLGLTADTIIETAAQIANEIGVDKISIKLLAEKCNIKSPSFYNHFTNLDEIKNSIMLYGWKQLEEKALRAAVGVSGYDAVKAICYAFYDYATNNAGIFDAMLWYNNFQDERAHKATQNMFDMIYKITASLNISEQNSRHLVRMFRSFLEGFCLLVNKKSFGHPQSVSDTFALSIDTLIAGMKSLENK